MGTLSRYFVLWAFQGSRFKVCVCVCVCMCVCVYLCKQLVSIDYPIVKIGHLVEREPSTAVRKERNAHLSL